MPKVSLFVVMILAISISAFAGDKLTVAEGGRTTADSGELTIKFVKIVEDSRCPPNVQCIWAGSAKIRLAVSRGKSPERLVELNTGVDPHSVTIYGYEIKLEALTQKHPEGRETESCPPVATLAVSKI